MARLGPLVGRTAGAFAIASGLAYVAYWPVLESPEWAITAWNLLIIPTALYLGTRVASRGPIASAASTAAGVTASLLWAFAYRSPTLEPWWIGLAAAWWLALGRLLLPERRALGGFTLLLGIAAAIDFIVTALNAPSPIYALGAFKGPLSMIWTFWIGLTLLRRPLVAPPERRDADMTRWSGATALVGGLLWVVLAVGWAFSHGSTETPRGTTFLALGALEFTRLLAVPAALLLVSLATSPIRTDSDHRRAASFAFGGALLGLVMVGLGAVLETSIVDPNLDFGHPAVQGGWILYLGGLVPVLSIGMLGLGFASSRDMPRLRSIILTIGLLTPLPVVAFFLSGVSPGGLPWDVGLAALHAAPGLGWAALGFVLLSGRRGPDGEPDRDGWEPSSRRTGATKSTCRHRRGPGPLL